MARWLIQASVWFDRLYDCFEYQINAYDIASADETVLQVLNEPGRAPTSKSWLWIRRGGPPDKPVVIVDYNPSRAGTVPLELMENYRNGFLIVDAYAGYNALVKKNNLTVVACHDHARRKFVEAFDSLTLKQRQAQGGIATQAIKRYKALYKIEADLKGQSAENIKATRQEYSLPLLNDFKTWLEQVQRQVIVSEKTTVAINYFINQFESLTVYCNDGRLPISNIKTEHVAKIIAVARKNFLFANTPSGATSSAKIYSMIITAIANGLEPTRYLSYVLTEMPKIKKDQSIEHLLPWNLTPDMLNEQYDKIPRP
jgi:transposase